MLRKIIVSIGLAAAVAAAPTAASADWTAGTSKVEVGANVEWSGNTGFTSMIGGVSCTAAHSEWFLEPGTTGKVNSAAYTASSCKGTGGLAGCTVTSMTATGLPWTTHTTGTAVEIANVQVDMTYHGSFCPYHELRLEGAAKATPDDAHAMTEVTLSNGAEGLEVYNGTTGATVSTVSTSGTLVIPPTGPYGIT